MMSAATLSLSRLLYQFHGQLAPEQITQVLAAVCILLKLQSQEIVKSAVGFVKVGLKVVPKEVWESVPPHPLTTPTRSFAACPALIFCGC
jgi:hypothetical protein